MGTRKKQLCFLLGTGIYICIIIVLFYTGFFCRFVYNELGLFIILSLGCLGIGISSIPAIIEKRCKYAVKPAAIKGLFLYSVILAVILFGMRYSYAGEVTVFSKEYIRNSVNLIPLASILGDIACHNWTVLIGNGVLFLPVGLLLPMIWERWERVATFLVTIILISLGIEALQVFMRLGMFDVDDMILYLLGGKIGHYLGCAIRKHDEQL